jgi:transcriptional antiterminator NusG
LLVGRFLKLGSTFVNSEPDSTNSPDEPSHVPDAAVPTVAPGDDINAPGTDAALPPVSSRMPEEALPLQAEMDAGAGAGRADEVAPEEDDAEEKVGTMALGPAAPLMDISGDEETLDFRWYILKVQVNREDSIRDALLRRIRLEGVEKYFGDVVVPTEDVADYTKSGKRRIVKRKLYPGYIVVNMAVNDDTWFLVRDTPGIGDFTGSAGRPAPLPQHEVEKLLRISKPEEEGKTQVRTAIPYKQGEHVRVKDGNFQNFEGSVDTIDEANGRVTVMINIFGRSTPVELEHWQIEKI